MGRLVALSRGMVYGYCAPLSLSCARSVVKHISSSLLLLPCKRPRTESRNFISTSLNFHQWSPSQVPIFATHFSFSARKMGTYRSMEVVDCIRPGEVAVVVGETWNELVQNNDSPVLVEFWADWCGPCRMVHREIEEIAKVYAGRISCLMVNADEDREVAEKYGIKVVPVVLLFKNGERRDSITGTMPYHVYVSAIEKLLSS